MNLLRTEIGGLAIAHHPEIAPELVSRAVELHRERDALGREACEKWGPGSSVSRAMLGDPSDRLDVAVKGFRWRGLRGALSDRLLRSRAARAVAGADRLRRCGVSSPECLAVAERRRFGFVIESYLITRFVADAEPLPAALPAIASSPRRRRALAHAVGDLVGALHAAGVDHPDFKHSNLLVGPGNRLAVLDLDGLVPGRRLTWRRRVRALGQLEAYAVDLHPWLPRTDRLRFLRAYLRHNPDLASRRRRLVADVGAWVERRLAAWARKDRTGHRHFPLAPRRRGEGEQRPAAGSTEP